MWVALGKVTVPTAGSVVRLVDRLTDAQRVQLTAVNAQGPIHGFMVQAWHANTGKVFVGTAGMSKATGVEVGAIVAAPATGTIPAFSMALTYSPNAVALGDVYLDVDTSGEGVVVSVLVT